MAFLLYINLNIILQNRCDVLVSSANKLLYLCFSDWFVFFIMTTDVFREIHKIRGGNYTLTFNLSPKVCMLLIYA